MQFNLYSIKNTFDVLCHLCIIEVHVDIEIARTIQKVYHAIPKHNSILVFKELAPQVLFPVIETLKLICKHLGCNKVPVVFHIFKFLIQNINYLLPERSLAQVL